MIFSKLPLNYNVHIHIHSLWDTGRYWYKLSSILQYKMHVPTDAFIII